MQRCDGVAPADDRGSLAGGDRLGDRDRARGVRCELEGAHRAVPEDRRRVTYAGGVLLRRLGADVEPHPAVVDRVAREDLLWWIGRERPARTRCPAGAAARSRPRGSASTPRVAERLSLGILVQRSSDPASRSDLEGVRHRPAHEDRVRGPCELLDDPDLVADLDASRHDHERVRRRIEQLAEHLELAAQQVAGCSGQELGDADDRGVRAVDGAERVVDVDVRERRERRGERRVVRLLAGMEAQVLEQQHVAIGKRVHGLLGDRADAVGRELDAGAEQLGEARAHRSQAQLAMELALRPAEVRAHDDARAARTQRLERRQGPADAGVVADPAVGERNVEVGAHQHAPALHRQRVERAR